MSEIFWFAFGFGVGCVVTILFNLFAHAADIAYWSEREMDDRETK